jgi:hypothetical protein
VDIKKGDMIGAKMSNGNKVFIITQVVKEGRFYFCYSFHTGMHSFLVWDPECHFLICEDVDPYTEPDLDAIEVSTSLIAALDKLFGLLETDDKDTDD